MNYYNEIDPHAAQWLRNLIDAGLIPAGDVDTRSIEDVTPNELRGYTQCHFFAGIGGWPLALHLAGWPDDRPVWTGSCPCQPFSQAGKGAGFADERHLWPAFFHLIEQCRPSVVFGEQVASKDGLAWLDLVQADLEGAGYACGAADLCAAGVGAPHIRQRLYWVAHADGRQLAGQSILRGVERDGQNARRPESSGSAPACRDHGGLAYADSAGPQPGKWNDQGARHGHTSAPTCDDGSLADANHRRASRTPSAEGHAEPGCVEAGAGGEQFRRERPGPTNGFWRDADWLFCRDGKWRPVEPGTFPLAHGAPARVGRLRAYGNAIVPQAAAEFISAYVEAVMPAARQEAA